ncbi:type II toxin-antitoxin system prevent-host-death family antitoxin [Luteimonas sp. TWI1416]|uniref:type II toxin-antitoxin system prevent-host-death family antitoxin n=1 Tax=unclassified Luteimonas TaxID=2629088 RepID=UPI003207E093
MELPLDLAQLQTTPAADVKVKGWPSLMRKVRASGAIVITNHNHPDAVVVDVNEYQRLVAHANAASGANLRAQSLRALQLRFDEHLSSLKDGSGLSKVLGRPAHKGRKIALGSSR